MSAPALPPRKRRRRPLVWLAGAALLALLLPAAIWIARLPLATLALSVVLDGAGLGPARFTFVALDLAGARIEGLRIGADDALRAEAVTLSWTPGRLLDGRVDHVGIDGLVARLAIDEDGGLAVDGLPPAWFATSRGDARPTAPPAMPLASLHAAIARLDLATPYGTSTFAGRMALSTGPDGAMAGDAALSAPRLEGVGTRVEDVSIRIAAAGRLDEPAALMLSIDGSAASVTADGLDLGAATAGLQLESGQLHATARMNAPAGSAMATLDAAPFDPAAAARLTADLHFDAAALVALLARPGSAADGRVDLSATIDVPQAAQYLAGALPAELPAGIEASGALDLALDRLAWSGLGTAESLTGSLVLAGRPGGIEALIATPLTLRNARADEAFLATGPAAIAALLRTGGDLVIGPIGGDPAIASLDLAGERPALAFEGRLAATGRDLDLTLDGRVSAALDDTSAITAPWVQATAKSLPLSGTIWSGDLVASDLVVDGASASAGIAARIAAGPLVAGDIRARRLAIDADAAVDWRDGRLTVEAAGGSRAVVTGLATGAGVSMPGPLTLRLTPGTHRIAVEPATGQLDGTVTLASTAAQGILAVGALSVGFASATLAARPDGQLAATFSRLRVDRGDTGTVRAARLGLSAAPVPGGRTVRARLDGLTLGRGDKLSPQLTATLDGMVKGDAVAFDLALADGPGSVAFAGKLRHDLAKGDGKLTIGKARLDFAPGILQPHDLLPEFAESGVARLFAVVQGHGAIGWTKAGLAASDLTVELRDGAFAGPVAAGEAFSLDLHLTGLDPPRTPEGQRIAGRLLVGRLEPIPLSASFALAPGPILRIASLDLAVAGGTLSARPFRLDAGAGRARVTFDVDDLDLAALFDLLGVKGLTGSGVLAGEIPMAIGPAGAAIAGGRLAARGPGTLSFDVANLPAEIGAREDIVGLVVRTLAGFRYDALSLGIDKEAAGQGKLALRLEGANEAVLDGHPFIFNITLDANFDRLVALAVEGFATADSLLDWAARGGGGNGALPDLPQGEN